MLSQVHDFVELHLGLEEYSALQITEFVGIALVITVLSTWVYSIFFHPLAHIPGPFAAKITHMWQNVRYWRGSWHQDILDVHEKYGPVVRISPDEISFVDGDALKRLYGHVKPCVKVSLPRFLLPRFLLPRFPRFPI
jgi:hypothetical protein